MGEVIRNLEMQCGAAEERAERKGAQVPALNTNELRFGTFDTRYNNLFWYGGKEGSRH